MRICTTIDRAAVRCIHCSLKAALGLAKGTEYWVLRAEALTPLQNSPHLDQQQVRNINILGVLSIWTSGGRDSTRMLRMAPKASGLRWWCVWWIILLIWQFAWENVACSSTKVERWDWRMIKVRDFSWENLHWSGKSLLFRNNLLSGHLISAGRVAHFITCVLVFELSSREIHVWAPVNDFRNKSSDQKIVNRQGGKGETMFLT